MALDEGPAKHTLDVVHVELSQVALSVVIAVERRRTMSWM